MAGGDDIAFLGMARQAEMVRDGEVSPTELVGQYARADRSARSRAERLPQGLRRQSDARSRTGRGAAERRRQTAAARRADRDQGRNRRRRRDQPARHRRLRGARQGRRRGGAPPARGGRDHRRPDAAAGAGDLRLHRVGHLRRHPQPLEPAAHAGRLERRLGRGGRRRPGADRLGRRRRRLDPHPRRLLRPLRHQGRPAAASRWRRSSKAGAGMVVEGCVSRSVLDSALWLDIVSGGSTEAEAPAAARPSPSSSRSRTRPASCASPGRPPAPRAIAAGRPSPTRSSRRPRTRPPSSPGSATMSRQRDPDWGNGRQHDHRPLPQGRRRDRRRSAAAGAPRTAHPWLRQARRPPARVALRKSDGEPPGRDRPHQLDLRRPRRAGDAGDGRHRAAGPPLAGPRRPRTPSSG